MRRCIVLAVADGRPGAVENCKSPTTAAIRSAQKIPSEATQGRVEAVFTDTVQCRYLMD